MEKLTLTTLRKNIFQVADRILETDEAVVIERHGRRLVLTPESVGGRLDRLPRRNAIIGDPEDLVHLNTWDEAAWQESNPLA